MPNPVPKFKLKRLTSFPSFAGVVCRPGCSGGFLREEWSTGAGQNASDWIWLKLVVAVLPLGLIPEARAKRTQTASRGRGSALTSRFSRQLLFAG
jgi:hypothetical protein